MARNLGSKQRILEFFLSNIGTVLDSKDIQAAGGSVDWARRVRELRNKDGYQILSHKDRGSLKPNQLLLETTARVPAFARGISNETRAWVIEHGAFTCLMCGASAGDADPFGENGTVRLVIGHKIDKLNGGEDTPGNLRAVCTDCNSGIQNIPLPLPDQICRIAQMRGTTFQDQVATMIWLRQKFDLGPAAV